MFEKGKRYRIKTMEELRATDGVYQDDNRLVLTSEEYWFEIDGMDKYCNSILEVDRASKELSRFGWGWDPWMTVEVKDTKRRLLEAIKDFV